MNDRMLARYELFDDLKGLTGFFAAVILVDTEEDVIRSQVVDELAEGFGPGAVDELGIDNVGSDEDLLIIDVASPRFVR